jgi:hypothetical protein
VHAQSGSKRGGEIMTYILQNIETGRYVAPPGSDKSYTRDVLKARKFQTRAAAQNDACGNERVLDFYQAIDVER